ncbi:GspH/FimT family pseudopilin [Marinobacter sp. ELB17]|uniref:GspH/FimT family pseudopilin n=1 Tax=Marinobacter sp. ELB17 TaxID=270374 RepID=UPI0000F3B011|nr:GspH/FimT family pseudopilin [Marinobacter sp. ELB17]EAZ99024.1 putative type-4 fimbrial pilin related signal peptide protein [Marinobacter sp. ELB17]
MYKSRGFTLLELMLVVVIVAILITIAVPSFQWMIQKVTIASNVNTFLSDMRYARSEAIRRGGGVVLCRSDAPEAAAPTCGNAFGPGGNGWVSGWIIFHDLNNSGTKGTGDPLLRVQAPIIAINSIVGTLPDSSSSTTFSFTATGRLRNLTGVTTMPFGGDGLFAETVQRVVCISLSGRARVAGDGTTSCG